MVTARSSRPSAYVVEPTLAGAQVELRAVRFKMLRAIVELHVVARDDLVGHVVVFGVIGAKAHEAVN